MLAAAAVLAIACSPEPSIIPTPTASAAGNSGLPQSPSATPCGGSQMSVDYGPYYIAGLYDPGTLAFGSADPANDVAISATSVVATVVAVDPGARGSMYGHAEIVTPVDIDVELPIRGTAPAGRTRVFVEGGTLGCYTESVDAAPHVDVGARYLLFLTDPTPAAEGQADWPRILFAWPVDLDDTVHTVQGPMPLTTLVARIRELAPGST